MRLRLPWKCRKRIRRLLSSRLFILPCLTLTFFTFFSLILDVKPVVVSISNNENILIGPRNFYDSLPVPGSLPVTPGLTVTRRELEEAYVTSSLPTRLRLIRTTRLPPRRLLYWPVYTRFDSVAVTPETTRPDPYLLFKLLDDMEALNPPLFKLAKTADHDVREIPRIIHQSWRSMHIPNVAKTWIKKWTELNPDYTYIFWTNSKAQQFVEKHYPWIVPYYNSYRIPVAKIDLFRYIALFAFGGFWADMDMQPLKSIEPVRSWSGAVLGKHPDIQTYLIDNNNFMNVYATNYTATMNAFFASRPRHPFLFYLISRVLYNSPRFRGDHKTCNLLHNVVGCSGPSVMAMAYGYYVRSVDEHVRKAYPEFDVVVPDADYFFPTFDLTYPEHLPRIRRRCRHPEDEFRRKLCRRFRYEVNVNKPKPISFTVHNWAHTYMAKFERKTRFSTHLRDIVTFHTYDGSFERWNPPFEQYGRY